MNIYKLFREYIKLDNDRDKHIFMLRLDSNDRSSLKNYLEFSNKQDRFNNIYDGWIDSLEHELLVLEVYGVILNTIDTLNSICINDSDYEKYIASKKSLLHLLLSNKQYESVAKLLSIKMYNKSFKTEKMNQLRENVLEYLIEKRLPLPNKLIEQIYGWTESRRLPAYMVRADKGDFEFHISHEQLEPINLEEEIELAIKKYALSMDRIVENLINKGYPV